MPNRQADRTGWHGVGVDPGKTHGAAVWLEITTKAPHVVRGAWAWRETGGGYQVATHTGEAVVVGCLHDVGEMIADAVPWGATTVLSVEGLYLDRMEKAPSIITLAEATGEVVGPLRARGAATMRPNAATWRAKVLRMSRASAAAFARRSIQVAPCIANGLDALAQNEHATDALAIAYYGVFASR